MCREGVIVADSGAAARQQAAAEVDSRRAVVDEFEPEVAVANGGHFIEGKKSRWRYEHIRDREREIGGEQQMVSAAAGGGVDLDGKNVGAGDQS